MKTKSQLSLSVILSLALAFCLNAQVPKRNLIANSNFEDEVSKLKHWRWDGLASEIACSAETENPIAGTASAKIEVKANTTHPWNLNLYNFFPVEEYAKYKVRFKVKAAQNDAELRFEVCESFDNQTNFKPLNLESWSNGFTPDNTGAPDLRGKIVAGTEVTEYEFITKGDQFGFPSYIIAFHFGHATKTTFWFDDIRISRIDDGDWDGNLFPTGNFESARELKLNSQGYYIDGRTNDPLSVAYLDDQNPISGNKSVYIYKSPNENHTGYWELSYHFQFWRPDVPKLDISLKAKATGESKLPMRLICHPWGYGGGDVFQWEIPVNTNLQNDVRLGESQAIGWLGKGETPPTDYSSVVIPPFHWDETANNGHRGQMSLHGTFLNNDNITKGVGIWIDDVVIKESQLSLQKFSMDYAPTEVGIGQSVQFKINDFVYPTHAPTKVDCWVENGTGSAEIDDNLNLKGLTPGNVTVVFDTPNMTNEQRFSVNVLNANAVKQLNTAVIQLSASVVQAGQHIEIKAPVSVRATVYNVTGTAIANYDAGNSLIRTSNLIQGMYLVKIQTEDGLQLIRKFMVE